MQHPNSPDMLHERSSLLHQQQQQAGSTDTNHDATNTAHKGLSVLLPALPGMILMTADSALSFAALPHIGSEFRQLPHVSWFMVVYSIGVIAAQPIYCRLSDNWGRKPVLLISYGMFGLGIAACSLCYTFWPLVAARSVVGVGAAGMAFMLSIILNDVIPHKERPIWQIPYILSNLLGQLLGGVIGGRIVDNFGWRLAFRSELLLTIVPIVLVYLFLSHPNDTKEAEPLDVPGAFLLGSCLACLVLALSLAGNDFPWSHPVIYSLIILWALLLGSFIFFETRYPNVPLVPIKDLRNRDNSCIMGTTFCTALTDMGILYLVPFYVQASGKGTVMAGGVLNTLFSFGELMGWLTCILIRTWKLETRYFLTTSRFTALASVVILSFANGDTIKAASLIFAGASSGATHGALLVDLLQIASKKNKAIMYGVWHLATAVGNLISIPVLSSILWNETTAHLKSNLDQKVPGGVPQLVKKCLESLECLDDLPKGVRDQVRKSFLQSMKNCFEFVCAASFVAFVISVFWKAPSWLGGEKRESSPNETSE